MILHVLKKIKMIFHVVLLIKLYVLMIILANQLFFIEVKMQFINLLKKFLKSMIIAKKTMKQHFNKYLNISLEDEKRFHSGNKCWIYERLFTGKDKKVREHDHITGKYRDSAHSDCNIIKLTKKFSLIFHNLRGCESHLIMQEIGKFDIKVNVIPNGLEKYMVFIINKNLVFIESM